MRHGALLVLLLLALGLAACGGEADTTSEPAASPAEPTAPAPASGSTSAPPEPAPEPPASAPAEPAAEDGWILALARRVGPGATSLAAIDHEAVRQANGLDRPGDDPDAVADYLAEVSGGDAPAIELTFLSPRGAADVAGWRDEIGFSLVDLDQELTAGDPPDDVLVVAGDLDGGRVLDRLGASDGATAAEHEGVPYVAVGEDGKTSLRDRTTVRSLGESLRVAADDDVAVLAPTTAAIEASIDAAAGGASLADDPALAEVVRALEAEDVYGAFAWTDVAGFAASGVLDRDGQPLPGPFVAPYVALGIGATVADGAPVLVLAFLHDDEAAAAAAVDRVRAVVEQGASATGPAWSELVEIESIEARGRVALARLRPSSPALWARVAQARDTLVAWAP
ncbi:MAG: hypothetical protein R3C15_12700 [Thermoleophilia bacterium]